MSGTIKLSYHFNEDVMVLSFLREWLQGGRIQPVARDANPASTLAPDFNTEFPGKPSIPTNWASRACSRIRTVRLNATLFDQQYTNFQLNTYTGLCSS